MPMPPPSPLELASMRRSRRAKRRAAPRRPAVTAPSLQPWRAAILAVDPGNISGWAIWLQGRLAQFGTVDVLNQGAEVERIVAALLQLAEVADLAPVLQLERPYSRRALGASRPIWRAAWLRAGVSERRIVRAWPARWRAQLFGHGMGRAPQEAARRAEQLTARTLAGVDGPIPHDAAAAICQGRWGSQAAEVGRVLPVRYREVA